MRFLKKFLPVMLMASSCGILPAANPNLIPNGDFEGKNGYWFDYAPGIWIPTLHTEEASWNKCYRMELQKFMKNRKGTRLVSGYLAVGKSDKFYGVPVKPDTEYEVTFSLKSTFGTAFGVRAVSWDSFPTSQWAKGRKRLSVSKGKFAANANAWTRCRTTFRTGSTAKTAAVIFQAWADESQQKNFNVKLGDYYMIDNVEMREISNLKTMLDSSADAPTAAAPAADAITLPASLTIDHLYPKGGKAPAPVLVQMSDDGDALLIKAECKVAGKLRDGNTDSKSLWQKGDVLEVFFGDQQFAIGAGGGRYNKIDQWQGKVTAKSDKSWHAELRFPYTLIGKKELIKFNIARSNDKNSTVTLAVNVVSFNDHKHFAVLVFPEYRAAVKKEFANAPQAAAAQVTALDNMPLSKLPAAAENLRDKIRNILLGKAKFLLSSRSTVSDCAEPMIIYPENLISEKETVKVSAVLNEIASLPLALTNRTNRTERYQIAVHRNSSKSSYEKLSLGENAPKVIIHEAVVVKDSESAVPSRRYDPLPELNSAGVVTIAPGESALLWINFDCRQAKAGNYPGFLRITPLSEPAVVSRTKYQGEMKDYPLNVEVLDFKLPYLDDICLLGKDENESFFDFNMEMNAGSFIVSPYSFKFGFDAEGNRIKKYIELPNVAKRVKILREKYPHIKTKFFVGYSAFIVSTTHINKLDIFTPRGRQAWMEQIRGIAESMKRAGVRYDEYTLELFDEPVLKDMKRDLEAARLARLADPKMRISITWCVDGGGTVKRHQAEHIRQFDPYLSEHVFWHGLPRRDTFQKMIKEFKSQGKMCGFYACSTSMQLSLYNYYRMHAWKAVDCNTTDPIMLYHMINCSWGASGATSWKHSESGGITYRYGDRCVKSIRSEALRQGLDDMRYMKLLRQIPGGEKIADEYFKKVNANYNNESLAAEFRTKALEFLRSKK